jgi:hypothetical protein
MHLPSGKASRIHEGKTTFLVSSMTLLEGCRMPVSENKSIPLVVVVFLNIAFQNIFKSPSNGSVPSRI